MDAPADAQARPVAADPLVRQSERIRQQNAARQANLHGRRNVAAAPLGGRMAWVRYLKADEKDYARPRTEVGVLTQDLWADGPGHDLERRAGANLRAKSNFKAIDNVHREGNDWIGTSLKSRNLMNHTMSNRSATRDTLNGYLKQLRNFTFDRAGGRFITVNANRFGRQARQGDEIVQLDRLALLIAIPTALREGPATRLAGWIEDWAAEMQRTPIVGNANTGRALPITIAVERSRGHWQKDAGYKYEELLDCRIHGSPPGGFPVIDMLRGSTVTSVKTMNTVKNYRHPNGGMNTTDVQRTIEQYIWSLRGFDGGSTNQIRVTRDQFDRKVLRIAIPTNTGPEFDEVMRRVEPMARRCDVEVLIDRIAHAHR